MEINGVTVRGQMGAVGMMASWAAVAVFVFSCAMKRVEPMRSEIPREVLGWVAVEDRTYGRRSLYSYIDGGAELYLAYRFRRVDVSTYRKEGEADIILDLYDMGTPEDAYGVFTAEREDEDIGIGERSEYGGGLLRFFKGRFFVSVMAAEETTESREAVFSLGRAVADTISPAGGVPELIGLLPQHGLIGTSIRYFYHPMILNLHYYLAEENILELDEHTRAVLARYTAESGAGYLLLIRYSSASRARAAGDRFARVYMPDATEGMVRTENNQWTATAVRSRFVAVVLDAATEHSASELLQIISDRLEGEE